MKNEIFEEAIKDASKLKPVLDLAYRLDQPTTLEMVEAATEVNKNLGKDLFEDLAPNRLVLDFDAVARGVAHNATKQP